jgi:hypothetical protein
MPFDALEYVVRPNTTPDAHGHIIIPSTPRGTQERATLTWGATSKITVPSPVEVSDGVNFEVVCCQEGLTEQTRVSEEVTIRDPEGSTSYVTVQRPKTVSLKKKDKAKCLSGPSLEDISDVAQAVNQDLAQWDQWMKEGTTGGGSKNCSVKWTLKNEEQ